MEFVVVEEKKNKIVFKIPGASHGFCTMLREQLREDEHIKVATYRVDHPLVNVPQFLIETDGADPRAVVASAIKKLSSFAEKTKKEFEKALK